MCHWAALLRLGASVGLWGRKKRSRTCWPGLGFFRLDGVDTWDLLELCLEGIKGAVKNILLSPLPPLHCSSSDSSLNVIKLTTYLQDLPLPLTL